MADSRLIRGDMDHIYDDEKAVCKFISSYINFKGDVDTGKVTNKFYNMEILEGNGLFYFVRTSGRLGDSKNNTIIVRRLNSEVYVRELYDSECKKMKSQGYNKVEVVSIYPNCSRAAQKFISEKNVISKDEAKDIVREQEEKGTKLEQKSVLKKQDSILDSSVSRLVKSIYYEANQRIETSIVRDPEAFKQTGNPLGMLNIKMIQSGRECLDIIAEAQNKLVNLKRESTKEKYKGIIVEYSNRYYNIIPHKFSSKKLTISDWLLDTGDKLYDEYELLDVMELTLSNAVLGGTRKDKGDIDALYAALNSDITLVKDKEIIDSIKKKMREEQLHNHHVSTELVNVYEINQKNAPKFNPSCGNVVSLFHGTRAANLMGILSTSIKLPHNLGPNVVLTGAMFGPGVYFGQYSKSLQYSMSRFGGTRNKGNSSYLFICDVALGNIEMLNSSRNSYQSKGYNSVMGVGQDAFYEDTYIRGIGGTKDFKIPKSVFLRKFGGKQSSLLHNEYIVYNQERYRIRYLIEVREKSKK